MTVKEYLQQPYARIVIPLEEGGFFAELLEFFGCVAQGETVTEAFDNLEAAAEAWIENALEQGHEIPKPSSAIDYSGRIVLRLPQGLHQQAARLAERDHTSLNTFLVSAVANKVGAEDLYGVMVQKLETTLSTFSQAFLGAWKNYYLDSQTSTTDSTKKVRAKIQFNRREAVTAGRQAKLVGIGR